jgi:hypothetical protein
MSIWDSMIAERLVSARSWSIWLSDSDVDPLAAGLSFSAARERFCS